MTINPFPYSMPENCLTLIASCPLCHMIILLQIVQYVPILHHDHVAMSPYYPMPFTKFLSMTHGYICAVPTFFLPMLSQVYVTLCLLCPKPIMSIPVSTTPYAISSPCPLCPMLTCLLRSMPIIPDTRYLSFSLCYIPIFPHANFAAPIMPQVHDNWVIIISERPLPHGTCMMVIAPWIKTIAS